MQLTIPDHIAQQAGCSGEEMLFGLAVGLLMDGRLTIGQAARLAGEDKAAFIDHMGRRGLALPYDESDLSSDLHTLRRLWPNPAA
jgi:predicted HTH domain antitoxin